MRGHRKGPRLQRAPRTGLQSSGDERKDGRSWLSPHRCSAGGSGKGQQGVLRYPQHSRLSSQFLGPQRMLTPLETRAKHIPHQPQAMAAGS